TSHPARLFDHIHLATAYRLPPVVTHSGHRDAFAERNIMEDLPVLPDQSALTLANFTTLPHFSVSWAMSCRSRQASPEVRWRPTRQAAPSSWDPQGPR